MTTIHPVLSSKPYHLIRTDLSEVLQLGPGVEMLDSLLLSEPGWTLHELDFKLNHAVFIDVGADTELFTAGFSYQRQMQSAKRVAMLSFENFLNLSQSMKRPKPFVHLFNIGHCGSTLLHQVINESGAAWSLSEPKFTFDIAYNRAAVSEAQLVALASASLRFLSLLPKLKTRKTLVLKHFSQAMKILDTWNKVSPDVTNLFLYRDAFSHANSRFGFGQRKGRALELIVADRRARWSGMSGNMPISKLDGLLDIDGEDLGFEDLAAVTWGLMIKDYQAAKNAGMKLHAFNYQQLTKARDTTVAAIFAACGIDSAQVAQALAAFDRDSHAGEETARDKPVEKLPAEAKLRIEKLLRHPALNIDPEIVL